MILIFREAFVVFVRAVFAGGAVKAAFAVNAVLAAVAVAAAVAVTALGTAGAVCAEFAVNQAHAEVFRFFLCEQ